MSVATLEDAKRRAWRGGLIVTKKEKAPKRCLANVLHVLARHPEWQGVIAYDAFAEGVVCLREPPAREQDRPQISLVGDWTDEDSARTVAWISTNCDFEPSVEMVEQAVQAVARRRVIHPVRDYLGALRWDGQQRLPALLVTYFGATDTAYARAIGLRWMVSAVARAFRPGCQADYMLVLEGQQGIGKSTGARMLGGEWYADTGIALGDKDSYQALRRVWIYEFAELAAIKGREAERVKNFVSSRQDHYRPSYARRTRDFPRQCVFIGSTNEQEYLPDRTGNRRFWPVRCGRVDIAGIQRDRDQLWAEAVARFESGEAWHTDSTELVRLCQEEQEQRTQGDPWVEIISAWLAAPAQAALALNGVTTTEVLRGALSLEPGKIGRGEETRAGLALRDLKWAARQVREHGAKLRRYYPSQPSDLYQPPSAEVGATNEHESC